MSSAGSAAGIPRRISRIGVVGASRHNKVAKIRPQLTRKLGFVRAAYRTPYGEVRSAWEVTAARTTVDVTVPPNASATIVLAYVRSIERGEPVALADLE